MLRSVVGAAALVTVLLGCGLLTDEPTATPQPAIVSIEPPEVIQTEDTLRISYPCPWMLETYYNGHPTDMRAALQHVQDELNALIPPKFIPKHDEGIPPEMILHSREWLIEQVISCDWQKQKEPELQAAYEERQRENEAKNEEFKLKVQEWKARN